MFILATNVNFNEMIQPNTLMNIANESANLANSFSTLHVEVTAMANGMSVLLGNMRDYAKALALTVSESTAATSAFAHVSDAIGLVANVFSIFDSAENVANVVSDLANALVAASTAAKLFVAASASNMLLTMKQHIAGLIAGVMLYIPTMTAASVATDILSVATGLLNLAMNALPFIAIGTGIALLVVGIIKLIQCMNKASAEQQRLNADTQALKESTDDLTKSLEESKAAYAESTSKITNNAGAAEILAQRIYALSEEENKSAEAKRQLSVLVDQLNSTMPGLNLLYDEETDCLSQTAEQEVIWMAA